MFIDKGEQDKEYLEKDNSIKKIIVFFVVIFVIILGLGAGFYYYRTYKINKINLANEEAKKVEEAKQQAAVTLPSDLGEKQLTAEEIAAKQAEKLNFSDFYKKNEEKFEIKIAPYRLPINIKTDALNYYDVSRQINLDNYLSEINKNGFTIANNPAPKEADNFLSAYDYLNNKNLPILITDDFLFYYYQNTLKQIYKDIENNIFYDNLWKINTNLFNTADTRYRALKASSKLPNDPILEGARVEAIYYGVTLELLKPKIKQIKEEATDNSDFKTGDDAFYNFDAPSYLKEDINKETALIYGQNTSAKSPTFLYTVNYANFTIPEDYKNNSRLSNFYLATKWLNSVFPVYFKDANCKTCLLDKDDWRVNMIAASFIAKDLATSQNLKNDWAIIYKIMSFFTGLRADLTYLNYDNALKEIFGQDYKIEELFSLSNSKQDENLTKLKNKIAGIKFNEIEGSYDRNNSSLKSYLGLRVLAENYSPDNYLFSQLISPKVADYLGTKNTANSSVTYCSNSESRCRGMGLDIINLAYPLQPEIKYFSSNINYKNYSNQAASLKKQLADFNLNTWHNSGYWSNLNIIKTYLENNTSPKLSFTQNSLWRNKNVNTALGAWLNPKLPMDEFTLNVEKTGGLGNFSECNYLNYIEPNLPLVRELEANTNMILEMLKALSATSKANNAEILLNDLSLKLADLSKIIQKELNNQNINADDCKFIDRLTKQYKVARKGKKELPIYFDSKNNINESINGIKFALLVYNINNKNYLAIGPVFNYSESK
ncbi:MAG: DUF3160 domain-containing protein [Patescibacteria group bacterium]|nr:DUF3160 domain-containing protein [Patescibacteria group bacterium]MDD4610372.1 DUF3160 domain-containing protein [Patescibacteria group bacterium]